MGQLSQELVDYVVQYISDVDMLGYLPTMLSKTPVFCASERIYKENCQRTVYIRHKLVIPYEMLHMYVS